MAVAGVYRELGEVAWSWVLGQVREDDGPWLPEVVSDEEPPVGPADDRDSLYAGIAGLAPVLAEVGQYRALTDAERSLAAGIVARLSVMAPVRTEPSLYDGLGGDVTALKLLAPGRERVALRRLVELSTPAGWDTTVGVESGATGPFTDLVLGTAGVVLAAAWAGGDLAGELMTTGGEALLRAADQTEAGLDWRMRPGYPASSPNYSHGTAGVATALAIAGHALDRGDFLSAARQGAQHLLSVGSLDDQGFVVPHTLPYSQREVEPVTYTWCHGPSGTSQLFAALAFAGVEQVGGYEVGALRRRCLHSVLTSGLPRRLRPGFWDNDGRCCGTAGVGDVLLDAAQDSPDQARREMLLGAAQTMGDALVDRAIRDEAGARWRFVEYRQDPISPSYALIEMIRAWTESPLRDRVGLTVHVVDDEVLYDITARRVDLDRLIFAAAGGPIRFWLESRDPDGVISRFLLLEPPGRSVTDMLNDVGVGGEDWSVTVEPDPCLEWTPWRLGDIRGPAVRR
ncbi:lanthionine synthetase LanC family protein [Micromonospora soli]|uniref:lanthionine synthetase LanC family protein n=1 Tax=Micromonospora sp. NBRC 110009 TaxID=3061627 RepID=UPI002673B5DC|nr:lanthionine synthetase LanC family protein [Micromonospora sp. NBRC 110009]WKT96860.1 lanthionine synthetase LanC family protein [Micromonospora sp. NBRC 110009]